MLLAVLAVAVSLRDPLPGETALLDAVLVTGGRAQTAAVAVARATDLLPLAVVTAIVALALVLCRRLRAAALLLVASGTVWLVNPALKTLVARPRPALADLSDSLSEHSFPSGHAANSAVLVGAVVLVVAGPRHRRYVAVLGAVTLCVVAAAQLVLARHHPSDVVAGWLLAAAVLTLLPSVRADPGHGARTRRRPPT